jgi:hypothetical protein
MRSTGWAATALCAVALAWGGAGYLSTRPTDFHDYRVAAVQSAESAYDALASAQLTADALTAGRVTAPYAESMFDDSRDALAGAFKQFAALSPPDDPTRAMRDTLGPLLIQANTVLSTLEDDPASKAARPVADDLDDFIEAHK